MISSMTNQQQQLYKISQENKCSESKGRYLLDQQEKYKKDIIQPNNPLFQKIYGSKLKQDALIKERQAKVSKEQWQEVKEKKQWLRKQ